MTAARRMSRRESDSARPARRLPSPTLTLTASYSSPVQMRAQSTCCSRPAMLRVGDSGASYQCRRNAPFMAYPVGNP